MVITFTLKSIWRQFAQNKFIQMKILGYKIGRTIQHFVPNFGYRLISSSSSSLVLADGTDSLTLFLDLFLSYIFPGRSSNLYSVSALSCCSKVLAGQPAMAWMCVRFHRRSLMSSSLHILFVLDGFSDGG